MEPFALASAGVDLEAEKGARIVDATIYFKGEPVGKATDVSFLREPEHEPCWDRDISATTIETELVIPVDGADLFDVIRAEPVIAYATVDFNTPHLTRAQNLLVEYCSYQEDVLSSEMIARYGLTKFSGCLGVHGEIDFVVCAATRFELDGAAERYGWDPNCVDARRTLEVT